MNVEIGKELIKDIAQYVIPILGFIMSSFSLWRTRNIHKMESKIREYDLVIKKYEAQKVQDAMNAVPTAELNLRAFSMGNKKYVLRVYNKGSASAFNIDYQLEKDACIFSVENGVRPFEVLNPGEYFEEPVIYLPSEHGRKFHATITWKDEQGESHETVVVKSLE